LQAGVAKVLLLGRRGAEQFWGARWCAWALPVTQSPETALLPPAAASLLARSALCVLRVSCPLSWRACRALRPSTCKATRLAAACRRSGPAGSRPCKTCERAEQLLIAMRLIGGTAAALLYRRCLQAACHCGMAYALVPAAVDLCSRTQLSNAPCLPAYPSFAAI